MIRVTVELLPGGDESRAKPLGMAMIANDGTGTLDVANYKISLSTWHTPPKTWKRGKLEGFPRRRLGPWDLLAMALIATIGDRLMGATAIRRRSEGGTK